MRAAEGLGGYVEFKPSPFVAPPFEVLEMTETLPAVMFGPPAVMVTIGGFDPVAFVILFYETTNDLSCRFYPPIPTYD